MVEKLDAPNSVQVRIQQDLPSIPRLFSPLFIDHDIMCPLHEYISSIRSCYDLQLFFVSCTAVGFGQFYCR